MIRRTNILNIKRRTLWYKSLLCRLLLCSIFLALITRCTRIEELLQFQTPRESYILAMQKSPLAENPIFQLWETEGDSALYNALEIMPPFQHKVIYFPDAPMAWAWKLEVQTGRKVEFLCMVPDTSQRIFVDLFSERGGEVVHLETMSDTSLIYEAKENMTLLLRLQPEILIGGQATVIVKDYPIFGFPVKDASQRDIGSFWGDARDGGVRLHEGVDVFAARGTPVVAVADGRVSRTGDGGLGGKKVWLRTRNWSIYHAHLDSIMVHSGQSVEAGDTLGTVGNTGNARTTPPHLHFGIYRRGAVNPMPFIERARTEPPPLMGDINQSYRWGRILHTANIRADPSTNQPPLATLRSNDVLPFCGITNGWYEVELPGRIRGFVHHNLMTSEITPLSDIEFSPTDSLIYPAGSAWPVTPVEESWKLENYGSFGEMTLSRFQGHWVGVRK